MNKQRLNDESLLKCCTIYSISKAKHTWALLYTPGMLKMVGLLPSDRQVLQVVKAPLDLGE